MVNSVIPYGESIIQSWIDSYNNYLSTYKAFDSFQKEIMIANINTGNKLTTEQAIIYCTEICNTYPYSAIRHSKLCRRLNRLIPDELLKSDNYYVLGILEKFKGSKYGRI